MLCSQLLDIWSRYTRVIQVIMIKDSCAETEDHNYKWDCVISGEMDGGQFRKQTRFLKQVGQLLSPDRTVLGLSTHLLLGGIVYNDLDHGQLAEMKRN